MGAPGQKNVEGYREGVWVEAPEGPLGQVAVEGEGNRGGPRFLRVGCMVTARKPPEEEGGAVRVKRVGRVRPRKCFPLAFPLSLSSVHILQVVIGRRRRGSPTGTGDAGLG